MTDSTTPQDIFRKAWAVCNTFRGTIDPAQYKDYILTAMFLKYISDVWHDHYDAYEKKYGKDPERIARLMERDRFVLPMVTLTDPRTKKVLDTFRADFTSLWARRSAPNIGELIDITLRHIAEANHDRHKLDEVFKNIDFNTDRLGDTKERNGRLKTMLEDFADLDLRPSRVNEDVIGNAYIYLIEKFASDAGKKAGEFYTPMAVSRLLAVLANPQPGMRICDPACGSAGLLLEAATAVGNRNVSLYGQELNQSTYALALMNMFIHGFDSARIERGDSLRNPLLVENDRLLRFDIVVANPPFSLDKWGVDDAEHDRYNRFWRGLPPKSKGDYAFISHMVEVAKPQSGRVAVVVPHGVLFRGGAEGRIRQRLIDDNLLDAVIGLPGNLFPTTSIPVAILLFDRARERGGEREAEDQVLFVDASNQFSPAKTKNQMEESHIQHIVAAVRARQGVDKFASLVSRATIAENDYNLNIPRYVDTYEEEAQIDLVETEREIDRLEAELAAVRMKMKQHLKELGL